MGFWGNLIEGTRYRGRLGTVRLAEDQLKWIRGGAPVAGATAVFESGADQRRSTLTRVAAGGLLFGPAGAIVGGLFRKNSSRVYVVITLADGQQVIADAPTKLERQARQFAAKVNAASSHFA